jgi:aspartyl-tRNA(Asn)/glutamyl-tRNA(Gln) amidotransferase subunit C
MPISKEQVKRIAHLARLSLAPDQIETYTRELSVILDYIDQLKAVNTEGVEPRTRFSMKENMFREDEIRPSLPVESALANAPQTEGRFFRVPGVKR